MKARRAPSPGRTDYIPGREEVRERDLSRLAAIVENSDDAIISKDLNGVVTSWNAAAERLFGWTAEEILGHSILTIIPEDRHPEEDLILGRIRAGGRVDHFETQRVTKSGALLAVSVTVSPIRDSLGRVVGASKIARDITEQVRAKEVLAQHTEALTRAVAQTQRELMESHEALRRSERLAALGTMAAGLGHDIGNLLLPLRAGIDVVRQRGGSDPEIAGACLTMTRCADVFASLVRGLRLFGRGETDDQPGDMVDLAAWSADALPLLRNLAGRGVEVSFAVEAGLPPLRVGAGSITQAVANLVKNSADALESAQGDGRGPERGQERGQERGPERGPGQRNGRGWIGIRASRAEDGALVKIEVEDNGPGMSPEVLRHCMEPFYTTRLRGRRSGSGLGLALVYRAIEEAKGRVEIDSAPGLGTRVRLYIPAASVTDVPSSPARAQVRLRHAAVRALASSILRAGGYNPEMVGARDPLDPAAPLWVTDALGGSEFAARPPDLPVLLLSDTPLGEWDERVCRIGARPSASEFMQCLKSVRRTTA